MEPRHLRMVQDILKKYPYSFYVYGSRSRGTPRRLSDLDLCFKDKIPWNIWAHIEEDFEESDLPFTVDVTDYNRCDKDFRTRIDNDMQIIQEQPN